MKRLSEILDRVLPRLTPRSHIEQPTPAAQPPPVTSKHDHGLRCDCDMCAADNYLSGDGRQQAAVCGGAYDDGPYGVLYCTKPKDHSGSCANPTMDARVEAYWADQDRQDD